MTLVRQGILWSEIIAIFRRGSGIGSKESHVSEVAEKVGMKTRPTGVMLNARGLQARTTRRKGKSCRYFTFDLCEKVRAMREEAKDR